MLAQATAPKAVADLVADPAHARRELGTCRPPTSWSSHGACTCAHDAEPRRHSAGIRRLPPAAALVSAPPHDDDDRPRNPFQLAVGSDLLETAICGTPDRSVAGLERLAALGVDHVLLFPNMAGITHEAVVGSLRLFAEQVLPPYSSMIRATVAVGLGWWGAHIAGS